jgi:hypothetical protein
MVSLEAFSDLLDVLYSAPLDQEQWQRFLTLVCEYTRGKNGYFFCADTSAAKEEGAVKTPVRGVVLEFATRMRQSRGREVALND